LADVDPVKAAMLLCQFSPNSETLSEAESNSTDETKPRDFAKLRQRFEDLSGAKPQPRTLRDWLQVAKEMQMHYHSWINKYVEAVALMTPDASPESPLSVAPAAQAAPPALAPSEADEAESQRKRDDKCNKPTPLTTGQIAAGFDQLHWTAAQWKKPLGDVPKWLKDCRVISGIRGVREAQWNPVLIGAHLVRQGHAKARSVRAKFQISPPLRPWLEAWKTYEADNFDTD